MRRCSAKDRRQARRRGFCLLAVLVLTAGVLSLNRYVNTVVKPTLHELAEYEARSAAVQAMNRAVAAELTRSPALCDALFTQGSGLVSLDAAAAATPEGQRKIQDFLTATRDNILMGKDRVTAAEKGEHTGPASLADRVARHRVLHFKDADAYMEYQAAYGRGGALTGVVDHLSAAARSTALMERLGTNPEMMLQSLMAQETRELRAAEAGGTAGRKEMKALARLKQGLAQGAGINNIGNWWAVLSGQVSVPVNVGAARACAVIRAIESTGKLGGATLSAVADIPTKAAGMRVHGLNWPEAMARSVAQYFQGYGDKNKKNLCRDMGVMLDDTLGEMRLRWNEADDLPAVAAKWQDRFFRWSGLNYITEVGKAGYAMWFSGHMGEATVKPWAEVDKTRRATLQFHGITETNWDLVRLMTEKHPDGRTLLVPRKADDIPEATLRAHLTDEIAEIRKAAVPLPNRRKPDCLTASATSCGAWLWA